MGRLWAQRHGWDFYDLDALLEAEDGGRRTSRQIFQEEGSSGFQAREAAAARTVAPRLAQGAAVLAWGGGTVTNPAAVEVLRPLGTIVHLDDDVEALYQRILRGGRPAFLSAEHPWEDFQRIYRERTALLRALTPHRVDMTGAGVEEGVSRLEAFWATVTTQ